MYNLGRDYMMGFPLNPRPNYHLILGEVFDHADPALVRLRTSLDHQNDYQN